MIRKKITVSAVALIASLWLGFPLIAEESEGPDIYYDDGLHVDSRDGNNSFHIQGRVQPRFTYESREAAADTDGFAIQRGKIKLGGSVFSRWLKYGFQMNLATRARATTTAVCTNDTCTSTANAVTAESTTGLAVIEDYFIDYFFQPTWGLKVGQFKVPFLHQELTSSGAQQFVDRSVATNLFNLGRDIGATAHLSSEYQKVQADLFAMNGDGINTLNRNQGVLVGTRLHLSLLGLYQFYESDVNHSEEPTVGLGTAFAFNESVAALQNNTIGTNAKAGHGTIDAGFKYLGFSFQAAGMVTQTLEGADATNWGYQAQTGYFLIPKKFEVAGRTSAAILEAGTTNPYEHSGVINYFFKKHSIKLQTDYSFLANARGFNLNDHRVRSQVQVIF